MAPFDRLLITRETLIGITFLLSTSVNASSLHDIVENVWKQQPEALSQALRSSEFDARQQASQSWVPAPPSISLAHQTDRVFKDTGNQAWETELAIPLWLPGQKESRQQTLDSEQTAFSRQIIATKLKVAGLVRESYWQARLAENDLSLARKKHETIVRLTADVRKRVETGALSQTDLSRTRSMEQQANIELTRVQSAYDRANFQFQALTNQAITQIDEEAITPENKDRLEQHPYWLAAQAMAEKARRNLKEVTVDTRDSPELSLTLGQSKDRSGEPFSKDIGVKFTLPFSTDNRNRPKELAASAGLTEAAVSRDLLFRQLQAELASSRSELQQATEAEQFAISSYKENQQIQSWLNKAFQAGQLDLPAFLNAENDRFDAELALYRARLEKSRAIARYNQAIGVLP